MWYLSYDHNYRDDRDGYLCYAYSDDGVHWKRPDLGLVKYGGDKHNNILISGPLVGGFHGQTVFIDPKAQIGERFKMVYSSLVQNQWRVFGGVSPDGNSLETFE